MLRDQMMNQLLGPDTQLVKVDITFMQSRDLSQISPSYGHHNILLMQQDSLWLQLLSYVEYSNW